VKTLDRSKIDLKIYHPIIFQIGLILILALFIAALQLGVNMQSASEYSTDEQTVYVYTDEYFDSGGKEYVKLEQSNANYQPEVTPPKPPRSRVAAPKPEDEIIEDLHMAHVAIDSELQIKDSGPLPVPLESIRDRVGYHLAADQIPLMESGEYTGLKRIHENIEYPLHARRAGIEGRVYIQFIVNEQGKVEDPEVLKGIGGGADEAAIEAVKEARFWPGISKGQPVRFKMAMFIEFRLHQ